MMINFTVICLQQNCRDYQAQVNYLLNMKLTISRLNSWFIMRKISKWMSKLLQEINLQVLCQPHQHSFRQTVLYIISNINNRQYCQDNFQVSTFFKRNKNVMRTKTQLLPTALNNNFSSNPIIAADLFKRLRQTINPNVLHSYIFLLDMIQVFQCNKPFLCPTLLWIFVT